MYPFLLHSQSPSVACWPLFSPSSSPSPLPKDSLSFWSLFGFSSSPPSLQRSVLRPIESAIFSELKARLDSSPLSSASFSACLAPSSRA